MSGSNYCFLTCIQVSQEAGKVVWYSHLLKNIPQFVVIHTVKGFSSTKQIFFWNSLVFPMIQWIDSLISGSSAFYISLYICKFSIHVLLKPSFKDFEHNLAGMWDECNYTVIWTLFGIAFIWDWNENWPFPVLWPILWKC